MSIDNWKTNQNQATSSSAADHFDATDVEQPEVSFAETALRLGGKSADEARRTGAIDAADDQVEALFAPQYQTANSAVHRAVWERRVPTELFGRPAGRLSADVKSVMDESLRVVRRHRRTGTLLDSEQKISTTVLNELGGTGYWGLLVGKEYGGSGAEFIHFAQFLTRTAMFDPTVAGLASVHGCIGAVDPVRTFGTPQQKERFLPELASGRRLSAFALTEPCAGSDLTALRTQAVRDGDDFVVNGEKLFITNVLPGRTIGLVCMIEERPAVLIVDLPDEETDRFWLKRYGLHALKHTHNYGIVFHDFRVPARNLLEPLRGDGLTIAYHGLNLGRVALCANAAGTMRLMLANIIPWANFRSTYGEAIANRELVRRRIGHLAGLIVACDALVEWCAGLIDDGYRGEMECIVAKVFGSEAQKEAAVELFMKTHGGRAFLHGHLFGDNVHEFLAPCIYEGEGEMLGMAFFKSLVKQHGKQFFEPISQALHGAGIARPNLLNPLHLAVIKGPLAKYGKWLVGRKLRGAIRENLPPMPAELRAHALFAREQLGRSCFEISGTMRRHQLKLADRQCRMSELSWRMQQTVVILCTSLYAGRQEDEIIRAAGSCLCNNLRNQLTGRRPSDRNFRHVTELGAAIAGGAFASIAGVEPEEILMSYE